MIVDITNGRLDSVRAFAKKEDLEKELQERLDYLGNYSDKETMCELYHDFAPQSFSFVMFSKENGKWERWFNGGLIFFEEGDTGVSSPQFSVRIGDLPRGWSVHT